MRLWRPLNHRNLRRQGSCTRSQQPVMTQFEFGFGSRLCENPKSENPIGKLPPIYYILRLDNGVQWPVQMLTRPVMQRYPTCEKIQIVFTQPRPEAAIPHSQAWVRTPTTDVYQPRLDPADSARLGHAQSSAVHRKAELHGTVFSLADSSEFDQGAEVATVVARHPAGSA